MDRPTRHPRHLLADGYRLFFPAAALWAIGLLTAWAGAWAGRWAPWSSVAHGRGMLFGAFGAAVLGFLLTAYPKQNQGAAPRAGTLLALLGLHTAATVAGLALEGPLAAALAAAPWAAATLWSARIAAPSLRRGWDGTTAAVPVALGALGVGAALSVVGDGRLGLAIGAQALLALALAVLDRVLPFFSKRVEGYRGRRLPGFTPLLGAALAARAIWPAPGDLLVALIIARQWAGWRPDQGLRIPMVAALHLALPWILAGYAAHGLGIGPASLPLHLWLVGGLNTLLAGIAQRVSLGHGGEEVRLRPAGAAMLLGVQLAALLRVAAPLLQWGGGAYALASALLAAAWAAFLVGYGARMAQR